MVYQRDGDALARKNARMFGPGDLYCALWPLLGMAGLEAAIGPRNTNYWTRPKKLDDGGENVRD